MASCTFAPPVPCVSVLNHYVNLLVLIRLELHPARENSSLSLPLIVVLLSDLCFSLALPAVESFSLAMRADLCCSSACCSSDRRTNAPLSHTRLTMLPHTICSTIFNRDFSMLDTVVIYKRSLDYHRRPRALAPHPFGKSL